MHLTVQAQLIPDAAQGRALLATMERFNAAASWLAGEAFRARTANKIRLQQAHYGTLRDRFDLSAQMAIRCIAQVCEAYKRDRAKRPRFRPHAAVPYDQRLLSFKSLDRASLLTLEGRLLIPFIMGAYQRVQFGFAKGQADLVRRHDGRWFLLVSVTVPDGTPIPTTDFIGVDLGPTNLATTSDGERRPGEAIEHTRQRYHRRRQILQKAAAARKRRGRRPKNIRRALRRLGQREARFRKDTNHVIAKRLVRCATDTHRGLALEDLQGVRERTRFRRAERARMAGWSFHQLRSFVTYKAERAGIPVVLVDPAHTSQQCAECGYVDPKNRRSQAEFSCLRCGHVAHADVNAARNIRARALVMAPQGAVAAVPSGTAA